jgi:hypothetical protein
MPYVLQLENRAYQVLRVDIVVHSPPDLPQLLDQAVQRVIPTALERRQGILVTQVSPQTYTVEVDEGVTCGVIREKRLS